MKIVKLKLYAVVERPDGSIFKQYVMTLTEYESVDQFKVRHVLQEYKKFLGTGYYVLDYYFTY